MIDYTTQARIAYLSWLDSEDASAELWLRTLRDYAEGEHPVYLTDRQKEFVGLYAKGSNTTVRNTEYLFSHNLCGLIIDTVVERLKLTGFNAAPGGQLLAQSATDWWEANRMDAGQNDLYEALCRDGEAFMMVDWDGEKPRWTLNYVFDGTQGVKVHYDPSTNAPAFVSKRWQTYDPFNPQLSGLTRLNLYFPDRVEKYISTRKDDGISDNLGGVTVRVGWKEYTDAPGELWPLPWLDAEGNSLGIAAVSFRNPGGSEIDDVVSLQDLLNKSDVDLIAGADMSGFRILYASGVPADIDPSTGEEKAITLSPGKLVRITDPAGRLSAIEPADLSRMIQTCQYWIECIAAVSRTPHYIFRAIGADQPSGESLKQQEIGLLNKCKRKQGTFGNAWEDVIYLSSKLWRNYTGEDLPVETLQAQWAPVQTQDERATWEVAAMKQAAGIPKEQTWSEAGYTPEQIAAMQEQVAEEQTRQTNSLALAMIAQQQNFDRGQGTMPNAPNAAGAAQAGAGPRVG